MSTKQQLIAQVCQLLVDGAGIHLYGPASTTITAADRKFLESASPEFLENKLLQLKNEQIRIAAANSPEVRQINEARQRDHEQFVRDAEWSKIFRTPLPGSKVAVDNTGNRQIIESWLHPHETLSQEVFLKAITETPRLIGQLVVQSADVLDPKKQAVASKQQLEEDRSTFSKAAREIGLSDNEANFRLVREVLGSGFTTYAIGQAVDTGAVHLAAASQAEQEAYRQKYAEQRQNWLVNQASPAELREAANRESEQRRAAAVQQQAEQQLEAAIARDAAMGYEPIPEFFRGQKLDATFIKMCDVATHKLLLKRFGSAQLDLRLRGVK